MGYGGIDKMKKRNEKPAWKMNGAKLKWLAIITMFLDHFAAVILTGIINVSDFNQVYPHLNRFYCIVFIYIMRGIGRLAFPIFCFLLTEGIRHTSNHIKYGVRLALFAVISEVPFDLAFQGHVLEFTYQNVFFTLFIGYLTIEGLRFIFCKLDRSNAIYWSLSCLVIVMGLYIAQLLSTDYGAKGVSVIVIMYLCGSKKTLGTIASLLPMISLNLLEIPALIDAFFIRKYDGTRGKQMKYFFYFFYPVHLIFLYGLQFLML